MLLLVESHFNWFEFEERASELLKNNHRVLSQFDSSIRQYGFEKLELDFIKQPYAAIRASETDHVVQKRYEDSINGYIVTDSETDNLTNT